MSTTRLPEAFDEMDEQYGKDKFAIGYNAALEATGAKELWEALQKSQGLLNQHLSELLDARHYGEIDIEEQYVTDLAERMGINAAAIAKSNPSNTVVNEQDH